MIVSDLLIKQLGIAHEKYLAPMVQRTARQPGKLEIVGSTPRGVNQNFSFLSVLFCFLAFLMRPEWSKQVLVSLIRSPHGLSTLPALEAAYQTCRRMIVHTNQ